MTRHLLFALAFVVATAGGAVAKPIVVLLPFENVSGDEAATDAVASALAPRISARGWNVVVGADVEQLLEKHRVRYLDSVPPSLMRDLVERYGAELAVVGSIYSYQDDDETEVSMSARAIAPDGSVSWGDVVAITAGDTQRLFGFGKTGTVAQLTLEAAGELIATFPKAEQPRTKILRGPRQRLFQSKPAAFRAKNGPAGEQRICVLPFEIDDADRRAPRAVADLLNLRLSAVGNFELVEPAELRAAMEKRTIRSLRILSNADLVALGEELGTSLFIQGTVYTWSGGTRSSRGTGSTVHIELSLVDVVRGRVLWSAEHGRSANDYEGFLLRGAPSTVISLTDRVVSEIIETSRN